MAVARHPNASAPFVRIAQRCLAVVMIGAAVGVAVLMRVPSLHTFYWSRPLVFVSAAVVGPVGAYVGGWWLGRCIAKSEPRGWLVAAGTLLTSVGALLGLFSLWGASEIGDTGYWGNKHYPSYNGDYMILGFQLLAQAATMTILVLGGVLCGAGSRRHRPQHRGAKIDS